MPFDSKPLVLFLAALAGVVAASCSGTSSDAPPRAGRLAGKPPIVLVTLDTMRRDHLGTHGYFRNTSPRLDAFAQESLVFENAVASMASTLPSHLSMLTGLYPHQHGIERNSMVVENAFQPTDACRPIAMFLKEEGYATAAFVSSWVVGTSTGIDAGFDTFDMPKRDSRKGEATTKRALAWLAEHADEPFFLWIHYWDPHEPNLPPDLYASMFSNHQGLDTLFEQRRIDPTVFPGLESERHLMMMLYPRLLKASDEGRAVDLPPVDTRALQNLINRYDASVRYTDACVGDLLDDLDARGLRDKAIVAITGDHGQALGQHAQLGHAEIVNENVYVNWFLRLPPGVIEQPRRIDAIVSSIDLMPTILARLELGSVDPFLRQATGRDVLSGEFTRAHVLTARTANQTLKVLDPGRKYALVTADWKYVWHESGTTELYDLRADPDTWTNVVAAHSDTVVELDAALHRLLAERRGLGGLGAPAADAEEQLEALRRLGYVEDE